DIEIYLSDEAPVLVRATDAPDASWGTVVTKWENPYADKDAVNAAKQTYGTGDGACDVVRIDISLPEGSAARYVIVSYLSSDFTGDDGRYVNNTEFEAYGPSAQQAKIVFASDPATVYVSDFALLSVLTAPELSGETVSWSSSDETIVKVGSDGKVVSYATGEVTITATVGEYSATTTVTVVPNTEKPKVVLGKYIVLPESYRVDGNGTVSSAEFANSNVVSIDAAAEQPESGFAFVVSDIYGGYYDIGRGYGSDYRAKGIFVQDGDNVVKFTDYVKAGWETEWDKEESSASYEYVVTADALDSTKLELTLVWGIEGTDENVFTFHLFLVKELAVSQAEAPTPVIPKVDLPYEAKGRTFADDILPHLTGTYADWNGDGVVAVSFEVEAGELVVDAAGYTLWLFDDPSVGGSELALGANAIKKTVEAGVYYLVIDDDLGTSGAYDLSIVLNVNSVDSVGKAVKSVRYYDLLGRLVDGEKAEGFIIRQTVYEDGTVETKKEYVKN
ncbi:MAG: DUF5012 domain-containing protein, partial [Dysgonamonadaceae bacterium]|nr:DUF5012 domain-containing protein [Dysgonamonadaceae bacterium]